MQDNTRTIPWSRIAASLSRTWSMLLVWLVLLFVIPVLIVRPARLFGTRVPSHRPRTVAAGNGERAPCIGR